MGQTGSRVANKLANSFSFSGSASEDFVVEDADRALTSFKGTPFVFSRRGYGLRFTNSRFLYSFSGPCILMKTEI